MIRTRYFAVIATSLALNVLPASAEYGDWTFNSACPDSSNHNHWTDYMAAKFPPEPWPDAVPRVRPAMRFSGQTVVEFRDAKKYNDPKSLPGIDIGACYAIYYIPQAQPNGVPKGYRSLPEYSNGTGDLKEGLPGDPMKSEINVNGTILKFDSTGVVYDLKRRKVGYMLCYNKNGGCEKYR